MPCISGYDVCRALRANRETPVIFLTACDDEVNVVMGLEMGADDYVTKPFRIRELMARIKNVLRRRGRRGALAFLARTPAHAYAAYQLEAMQYLLTPVREQALYRLLDRAVEPEYGPTLAVNTAAGLRLLPYGEIEYLECTHHVVHFHLSSGEDVPSLSLRVPFSQVAQPLLEDGRFLQPHRSYVVNLARVERVCPDEVQMRSGARVPLPRGRAAEVRAAVTDWAKCPGRCGKE